MDLKVKKESLALQYNELTKTINKSLEMRSRVLGALELLHQIMNTCEKCNCENCECKKEK